MKKSQLRHLVLEAMAGGYEKKDGKLVPHYDRFDSTKLSSILTAIAKGRPEEDSEEAKVKRGHEVLNRANPDNVARITRGEKPIYEEGNQQTYLVSFRVGEDGDDDVEVQASSPEQAIEKLKSGEVKLAYGQDLPRLARGFSAKPLNK